MLTSVVGWVLFGLVAGAIPRVIHPGFDSMGYAGTILLGYATSPTQGAGLIRSIIGAVALLSVGGYMRRARGTV